MGARGLGEFFNPIAPIVEPAQQAHQHEARPGRHFLHIEIDGIMMQQLADVGGAQIRIKRATLAPGAGDTSKVAVGEGEKQNIGGRLPKVDRSGAFIQKNSLCAQKVHGRARYREAARALVIAVRSMPFSPMKTRLLARGAWAGQAPSKWWRKRAPTPCTSSRMGLPVTSR